MLNKEDYEQIDNLIILSQIGSYKKNSLTKLFHRHCGQ